MPTIEEKWLEDTLSIPVFDRQEDVERAIRNRFLERCDSCKSLPLVLLDQCYDRPIDAAIRIQQLKEEYFHKADIGVKCHSSLCQTDFWLIRCQVLKDG